MSNRVYTSKQKKTRKITPRKNCSMRGKKEEKSYSSLIKRAL